MDADEEADLVGAQTAILLDRQGGREAAQLLANVTYGSYRTPSGTLVYTTAVVLYVDDHLVSAFTNEIQERVAPVLIDLPCVTATRPPTVCLSSRSCRPSAKAGAPT